MEEVLRMEEVRSGYGEMEILRGLDLHVYRGECVVLIGPNGAGKSTILKGLMGIANIFGGRISLEGVSLEGLRTEEIVRKGVSYVPQVKNVFPHMSVEENLEMGGYIFEGSLVERMEGVYEMFPELREKRRSDAWTLSGGQRQMLAMGKALMVDPGLLLLDEPSAGVSPLNRGIIFESVERIKGTGVSILMVEQNVREGLGCADRGYVIVDGKVRYEGRGEDLLGMEDLGEIFFGVVE